MSRDKRGGRIGQRQKAFYPHFSSAGIYKVEAHKIPVEWLAPRGQFFGISPTPTRGLVRGGPSQETDPAMSLIDKVSNRQAAALIGIREDVIRFEAGGTVVNEYDRGATPVFGSKQMKIPDRPDNNQAVNAVEGVGLQERGLERLVAI